MAEPGTSPPAADQICGGVKAARALRGLRRRGSFALRWLVTDRHWLTVLLALAVLVGLALMVLTVSLYGG